MNRSLGRLTVLERPKGVTSGPICVRFSRTDSTSEVVLIEMLRIAGGQFESRLAGVNKASELEEELRRKGYCQAFPFRHKSQGEEFNVQRSSEDDDDNEARQEQQEDAWRAERAYEDHIELMLAIEESSDEVVNQKIYERRMAEQAEVGEWGDMDNFWNQEGAFESLTDLYPEDDEC
jgi:hypothetical protein